MAIKDIKLYNKKALKKVNVDYSKEYHTFFAKIQLHSDKVYSLMLINPQTKKEEYFVNNTEPIRFNVSDDDVERVDVLPDSNDIYKFYLVSDNVKDRAYWKQKLGAWMPDVCLVTQKLDYDLQFLSDEMFSYLEILLRQYEKNTKNDRVYVPLAHIETMEIFSRVFGEAAAAFLGGDPMMNVFVLMWLHGYLMSSAVKKQGVKLVINEEVVTKEEIEAKEKEMKEALESIVERFKQGEGWKNEEEEGDGGPEQAS